MSSSTKLIKVCGMDPSLRNWGLALGTYDLETKRLSIDKLLSICTAPEKAKQVRKNSLDLESAFQLYRGVIAASQGVQAVFVEVPHGSQSARAMASYGICVGVLGALRASDIPFFELSATEVKLAGPGSKTASKQAMIQWAIQQHPDANWPTYKDGGSIVISEAKAEHQADAVAAIYAGLACNPFKQLLPLLATQT